MRRTALAAMALLVGSGVAQAQQRPDPFADMRRQIEQAEVDKRQQYDRTKAATRPTKAAPMGQSLAELLSGGWTIVSATAMGGPLVLRAPSSAPQWAMCQVSVVDGIGSILAQPTSLCLGLN